MEIKYYLVNESKDPINLTEYGVRVEPKSQKEINGDYARIFSRNLNVRRVAIEQGKEIDNVSYREFLENSKNLKAEKKERETKEPITEKKAKAVQK